MDFTLTVLGTASAKPVIGRQQSAQVLSVHGRSFLIDCGEGVQMRLQQCRLSPMKIDSIFISHIHGDHVFGLPGLLSTMGMLSRTQPLNIYAPANFGPLLKFFLSYYGEGIAFEIRHVPLTMKEPSVVYETKSLEVSAFPLNHGIETFGFLFREKEPFEHRHADRLENRAPACTFFLALLGVIALIGEAVNALRGAQLLPGDAVFAVCAAVVVACAILCHRQWRRLRCIMEIPHN